MAINIFIARHGQNEDNANGILNGHRDLPLTEIGREQARQSGAAIKKLDLTFTRVYSSPLVRAYETAQIISTALGMSEQPKVLPEIIERDFGVLTGKPIESIPQYAGENIIQAEKITYFTLVSGAETFPELVERGHRALAIVRQEVQEGNVLLVCHGDFGKMMYAAATGKDWKKVLTDFHFGNGELIEVTPGDKAHLVELEQYNK
jgi:broad specificity phosphatase PhoE